MLSMLGNNVVDIMLQKRYLPYRIRIKAITKSELRTEVISSILNPTDFQESGNIYLSPYYFLPEDSNTKIADADRNIINYIQTETANKLIALSIDVSGQAYKRAGDVESSLGHIINELERIDAFNQSEDKL